MLALSAKLDAEILRKGEVFLSVVVVRRPLLRKLKPTDN